jgi:hypothetical protein
MDDALEFADRAAIAAMQTLLIGTEPSGRNSEFIAKDAYRMAEEMLSAREAFSRKLVEGSEDAINDEDI